MFPQLLTAVHKRIPLMDKPQRGMKNASRTEFLSVHFSYHSTQDNNNCSSSGYLINSSLWHLSIWTVLKFCCCCCQKKGISCLIILLKYSFLQFNTMEMKNRVSEDHHQVSPTLLILKLNMMKLFNLSWKIRLLDILREEPFP